MTFSATQQEGGLVYGIHAVEELVKTHPNNVERVYFDKDKPTPPLFSLLKECRRLRITYQVVPSNRLEALAPRVNHQGVVAQCPSRPYDDWDSVFAQSLKAKQDPLFLIPASVEDPHNLGAISRSAAAFGASAILLEQKSTAPLSGVVAKTAAGGLEHIAVCRPRNLEAIVTDMRLKGFAVIGAEAGAPATPSSIDFNMPCVVILGGESRGIPPYLRKQCTAMVGIPIAAVSSLNVSVATGILLYEAQRQRTAVPKP